MTFVETKTFGSFHTHLWPELFRTSALFLASFRAHMQSVSKGPWPFRMHRFPVMATLRVDVYSSTVYHLASPPPSPRSPHPTVQPSHILRPDIPITWAASRCECKNADGLLGKDSVTTDKLSERASCERTRRRKGGREGKRGEVGERGTVSPAHLSITHTAQTCYQTASAAPVCKGEKDIFLAP